MVRKIIKTSFILLLMFLSFLLGVNVQEWRGKSVLPLTYSVPSGHFSSAETAAKKKVDFNLYWQVWDLIENKYVDRPVDFKKVFYGSLEGEVAALGDPYSIFLTPEMAKKFQQELSSELDGIGAEVGIKNNVLTIISPLPKTPAQRAGLRAGDQILAIDGKPTSDLTLDQAVALIKGKPGTKVTLTIKRPSKEKIFKVTITRAQIHYSTVQTKWVKPGILDLQVMEFDKDTGDLFDQAIKKNFRKIKGIIVDLRGNPGGFLAVAVDMAGNWIPKGKTVVIEQYNKQHRDYYYSAGPAELKGIPTVVLVNGGSASAAEILSGALQDYHLATLVGEKTFGKGSVQQIFKLEDGSQLKLTIAKWLTPKGRMIDKKGIKPDVLVKMTENDYNHNRDPQLKKAEQILSQEIKKKK